MHSDTETGERDRWSHGWTGHSSVRSQTQPAPKKANKGRRISSNKVTVVTHRCFHTNQTDNVGRTQKIKAVTAPGTAPAKPSAWTKIVPFETGKHSKGRFCPTVWNFSALQSNKCVSKAILFQCYEIIITSNTVAGDAQKYSCGVLGHLSMNMTLSLQSEQKGKKKSKESNKSLFTLQFAK